MVVCKAEGGDYTSTGERPEQSIPEALMGKAEGKRPKVAWRREETFSTVREPEVSWALRFLGVF